MKGPAGSHVPPDHVATGDVPEVDRNPEVVWGSPLSEAVSGCEHVCGGGFPDPDGPSGPLGFSARSTSCPESSWPVSLLAWSGDCLQAGRDMAGKSWRPGRRGRPSCRHRPRTAATWPWGRVRRTTKASSGAASTRPPFRKCNRDIPADTWKQEYIIWRDHGDRIRHAIKRIGESNAEGGG